MKLNSAAVLLAVMLAVTPVLGQGRSETGPVADNEWTSFEKDFGAMLVITDKHDEFVQAWNKPAAPDYQPRMSTVSQAVRGSTVVALVLFTNCTANEAGNCDSEVDFRVLRPDGSVYAEFANIELWKLKVPPKGVLSLGKAFVGFKIEMDDPLGTYRFEAVVRDKQANYRLALAQSLEVVGSNQR